MWWCIKVVTNKKHVLVTMVDVHCEHTFVHCEHTFIVG